MPGASSLRRDVNTGVMAQAVAQNATEIGRGVVNSELTATRLWRLAPVQLQSDLKLEPRCQVLLALEIDPRRACDPLYSGHDRVCRGRISLPRHPLGDNRSGEGVGVRNSDRGAIDPVPFLHEYLWRVVHRIP